jgi:hypothetical protein
LLGASLVALLLGAVPASADTVLVLGDHAPLVNRPDEAGVVLTEVSRGDELTLLRQAGAWYEVVLPGARGGSASAPTGFIRVSQAVVWRLEPAGPFRAPGVRGGVGSASRFLKVDASYRIGGSDLVGSAPAFAADYAEAGSLTTSYGDGSGVQLDVMGGARLRGALGIGAGFSYYARRQTTTIDAQVPHPFFFDQPRRASFDDRTFDGREIGMHVSLIWMPRWNRRRAFMVYGGPSFVHLSQDVVSSVDLDDRYPFDQVTITRAARETRSANAAGFHVGADFSYFLTPAIGVGAGARYTRAPFDLGEEQDETIAGTAGHPAVSGGLRIRF